LRPKSHKLYLVFEKGINSWFNVSKVIVSDNVCCLFAIIGPDNFC
jgi:hypothetical protein